MRCRLALLLLFLSLPAWADSGLSMHGEPKYGPDFKAFAYVNPDAPKGGTLRLARSGSFDNLNPYSVRGNLAVGMSTLFGASLTSESLMARSWDEPFSLYGLIAQDVQTAPDRSWVEFTLNPRAHWNDGTPITVDDVLFSFTELRDHGRPNHRSYYKKVTSVATPAPGHIRFTFDTTEGVNAEMPLIMGLMPVLCKAWWQGRDISAPTLNIPVTSGPYKLSKVEPGRKLVFTRDEAYWGRELPVNRGQWNFATITYDYYRDDNIALQAFKAGAYDLRRESDPVKWLNGYAGHALDAGEIVKREIPFTRPEPLRGLIFNSRRPLFAQQDVREALLQLLDFDWMNRALFGNLYRRANSLFPNSELAATPPFILPGSNQPMRERYKQALTLLTRAGYALKDGVMRKGATPLAFEILLNDPDDEKIALEYARSLARLGITAKVRTVDSAQYQARLTNFDYDMTLGAWSSTLSPGNEQRYYWGSAAADQPGSRNYAGVKDKAVDALIEALVAAHTRADLLKATRALDHKIMEGSYVVPLYYLGRDLIAMRSTLAAPPSPIYGAMPETTWWQSALPAAEPAQ